VRGKAILFVLALAALAIVKWRRRRRSRRGLRSSSQIRGSGRHHLHDGDLLLRQSVKLVYEAVILSVRRLDLALEKSLLVADKRSEKCGAQRGHTKIKKITEFPIYHFRELVVFIMRSPIDP